MWVFLKLKFLSQIFSRIQDINLALVSRVSSLSVQDIVNYQIKTVIPQKNNLQKIMDVLDSLSELKIEYLDLSKNVQKEILIQLNNSILNTTETPISLNSTNNAAVNTYIFEQALKIIICLILLCFVWYVIIPYIKKLIISTIFSSLGITDFSYSKFGEHFSFSGTDVTGADMHISFYVPNFKDGGRVFQNLKITVKNVGQEVQTIYDYAEKGFSIPVNPEIILDTLQAQASKVHDIVSLLPDAQTALVGLAPVDLLNTVVGGVAAHTVMTQTSSQVSAVNSGIDFAQRALTNLPAVGSEHSRHSLDLMIRASKLVIELAEGQANGSINLNLGMTDVALAEPVIRDFSQAALLTDYFMNFFN